MKNVNSNFQPVTTNSSFIILLMFIFTFSGTIPAGIVLAKDPGGETKKQAFKSFEEKVSYCIGLQIGENLSEQSIKINSDILLIGINDVLSKKEKLLTDAEIRATMEQFQKDMIEKISRQNKQDGEKFLTENKKKKGVITLKSGLQYKVITQGTGKVPGLDSTVAVHYSGKLIDGTEFESSYKRGQPVTFPVKGVIPGWTEALQLMKAGSKWELYIPSQLAYGERGAGRSIGPNTVLIFTIELLSVEETK